MTAPDRSLEFTGPDVLRLAVARGVAHLVDPIVPAMPEPNAAPIAVRRTLHLFLAALRAPATLHTAEQDQAIIRQIRLCQAWLQQRGESEDGPLDDE